MTDAAHRARLSLVSDSMDTLTIEPLLVEADADPLSIVRTAAGQPATRIIGVVDADGILIGSLPILRLAEIIVARVSPETLLAGLADLDEAALFGDEVSARRVADVMLPPAAIEGSATLGEAFRLMYRRHLSGVYVVNADGRPVGYLDLLELTIRYLEALEAEPSSGD